MLDIKCYFVEMVALYSKRVLYGYKCELEEIYDQIIRSKRLATIEDNLFECRLSGDVVDELNEFKRKLNRTKSAICVDC